MNAETKQIIDKLNFINKSPDLLNKFSNDRGYNFDVDWMTLKVITGRIHPTEKAYISSMVTVQTKTDTYAILRHEEPEGECKLNTLYKFYYDTNENFFIVINGRAIQETSTAFNFLTVQS